MTTSTHAYSNISMGGSSRNILGNVYAETATINYDTSNSALRKNIIQWLNSTNPSVQHNTLREKHESDTGSWLIDGANYERWKEAENSFLWLNACAGAGKSVLCSTTVEDVKAHCRNKPNMAYCYWYFTFVDYKTQTVDSCLRSIIAQLYDQTVDTPEQLHMAFEDSRKGQYQPGYETLLKMLQDLITSFKSVFIVFDALDECPKANDEREKLLNTISRILSWQSPALHLLCTSRKETDIDAVFSNHLPCGIAFQAIQLSGSDITADIQAFVHSKLMERRFLKWDHALKQEIKTKLAGRADGMFRLVALQLEELSKARSRSAITSALDNLPVSLDSFYERLLLNIPQEESLQVFRALQWLTFAARPISVTELAEAAVASHETFPYVNPDDRLLNAEDILEIIPSGLAVVVTVGRGQYKDVDTVRLAHFSVKEYLMSSRIQQSQVKDFQLHEIEAHKAISGVSLSCLLHEALRVTEALENEMDEIAKTSTPLIKVFLQIPLLHYASKCWPFHVRALGDSVTEELLLRSMELITNDHAVRLWDRLYMENHGDFSTGIFYGRPLIDHMVSRRPVRKFARGRKTLYPLIYASLLGFLPLIRTLISYNYPADDPIRGDSNSTGQPLQVAAYFGHDSLVGALLEKNADVNSRGGYYGCALQSASVWGHIDTVILLLEAGADVNLKGGHHGCALEAASARRHIDVVTLLLEAGADVNLQGSHFGSALPTASAEGHTDVVSLLLEAGADVNLQGGIFGCALQAASAMGHINIVALLLDAGAHVNLPGGLYAGPLQAASIVGHIDIVTLLIRRGADPNAENDHKVYALHGAVSKHHPDIVRFLLGASARADIKGYSEVGASPPFLTPLQFAVYFGHLEIVQIFLDHGVDISEHGSLESLVALAREGKSKDWYKARRFDDGTFSVLEGLFQRSASGVLASGTETKAAQPLEENRITK